MRTPRVKQCTSCLHVPSSWTRGQPRGSSKAVCVCYAEGTRILPILLTPPFGGPLWTLSRQGAQSAGSSIGRELSRQGAQSAGSSVGRELSRQGAQSAGCLLGRVPPRAGCLLGQGASSARVSSPQSARVSSPQLETIVSSPQSRHYRLQLRRRLLGAVHLRWHSRPHSCPYRHAPPRGSQARRPDRRLPSGRAHTPRLPPRATGRTLQCTLRADSRLGRRRRRPNHTHTHQRPQERCRRHTLLR